MGVSRDADGCRGGDPSTGGVEEKGGVEEPSSSASSETRLSALEVRAEERLGLAWPSAPSLVENATATELARKSLVEGGEAFSCNTTSHSHCHEHPTVPSQ